MIRKNGLSKNAQPILREEDFPEAPDQLTDPRQVKLWDELVRALDIALFARESHEMIISYIRHVVNADDVSAMIQHVKDNHDGSYSDAYIGRLDKLGKMLQRETNEAKSFAIKLRITNSSYRDDRVRKSDVQTSNLPWKRK